MNKVVAVVAFCAFAASAAAAEQPLVRLEGGPLYGVQFSNPIDPARRAANFGEGRLDISPSSGIIWGFKLELEVGSGPVRDDCSVDLLFCDIESLLH